MKKNLLKELFALSIQPITYVAGIVFIVAVYFYFFIVNNFFVIGMGSTDIRYLFSFMPYIAILIIPAITMNLWNNENDVTVSMPISILVKFVSKWLASVIIFVIFLLLTVPALIIINFFGKLVVSQIITGYLGMLLYGMAVISLGLFIAYCFDNRILSFFITAGILVIINSIHLLPLYFSLPNILYEICQKLSVSWHFDAASKGIIDSRDVLFYIIITVLFLFLGIQKSLQRKTGKKTVIPCIAIVVTLLSIWNTSLYFFRIDTTTEKQFSVSKIGKVKLESLSNPLQLTYYVSSDLEKLYPQVRDVKDYLYTFANENKNITIQIIDPTEKSLQNKLTSLGITSQQLQTTEENKTSFITVYSSIVLEYNGSYMIIPFILSTATLEFDLLNRIETLISGNSNKALIVIGNGLSLDNDYSYVEPWLLSAGFECEEINPEDLFNYKRQRNETLIVLGSSNLTTNQVAAIETYVINGGSCFFATSQNVTDYYSTWTVTPKGQDLLIQMLDYWGICIEKSLLLDLSNYRVRMMGANDSSNSLYVNYPFWIVSLPQSVDSLNPIITTFSGLEVYWASPITLYPRETGVYTELIKTSKKAWLMEPDFSKESSFVTDPFITENLSPDQKTLGQYNIAISFEGTLPGLINTEQSQKTRLVVLSDQYFASQMVENTNSAGNLDFLVSSSLWLSGQEDLLILKNKGQLNKSLYKIENESTFQSIKKNSLIFLFVFMPLLVCCISIIILSLRRYNILKFRNEFFNLRDKK